MKQQNNSPVLRHHTFSRLLFTIKLLTSATVLHTPGLPLSLIIVSISLSLCAIPLTLLE